MNPFNPPAPEPATPQAQLVDAVMASDLPGIARALAAGAEVNAPDRHGSRPLHHAALVEEAKALLDAGAEINAASNSGFTALHVAARWNRLEVAQLLVERGADRTLADSEGATPLDVARAHGSSALIDWLKSLEGIVKVGDDRLHRAAIALTEFEQMVPQFFLAARMRQLEITPQDIDQLADDVRARKLINPETFDLAREIAHMVENGRYPSGPLRPEQMRAQVNVLLPRPDDAPDVPPPLTLEEIALLQLAEQARRMGSSLNVADADASKKKSNAPSSIPGI